MTFDLQYFARKLRVLKAEANVSTADVSEITGIKYNTLTRYCNATNQPSADSLVKLADYFGVSLDCLCGREEKH